MIIPPFKNTAYPEFVADQVLTSDNLNHLFEYLDEQGRMTRTQLSGIGIACGFNIITAADSTSITVTEGVGVTSEGYLVADKKRNYVKKSISPYKVMQCEYYNKFVLSEGDTHTQLVTGLWELMEEDDTRNSEPLDATFLTGKIVLLFVEKLETNNKNCDPSSCDEKGTTVTVTIRALLADSGQVDTYLAESKITSRGLVLPEIKMPRYNAASPALKTATDILNKYRRLLLKDDFIIVVKKTLIAAYEKLNEALGLDFNNGEFDGNEFEILEEMKAMMSITNMPQDSFIHLQYFYDFISDLILAYDELRIKAFESVCDCVPDDVLFPRHLLVGEAKNFDEASSGYRTRFIRSGPGCCCAEDGAQLQFLYRRMKLMAQRIFIRRIDEFSTETLKFEIKITPSSLGASLLSHRAIPYYYHPATGSKKLYRYWSYKKSQAGVANKNLSYWAEEYNDNPPVDLSVTQPLDYDIEPYNFFRVEGIIGKNIDDVSLEIKNLVNEFGLPFKIVSLATGNPLQGRENEECCSLADIELQYQVLRRQLRCCLRDHLKFWSSLEEKENEKGEIIVKPPIHKYREESKEERLLHAVFGTNDKSMAAEKNEGEINAEKKTAAKKYLNIGEKRLAYKEKSKIKIGGLPAPSVEDSPADNISYYALVLADELEDLVNFVSEADISNFNIKGFEASVSNLEEAYKKIEPLLSTYHSRQYYIDKVKINTGESHAEEVNAIATAMSVLSDSDVINLITIINNSAPGGGTTVIDITEFIEVMKDAKYNYAKQGNIIDNYLRKYRDSLSIGRTIKEPKGNYTSDYDTLVDYVSKHKCTCDINALKFLLQRYNEQQAKLTDMNNFSVYASHHPGLQHKAGVTAGGTLVLVYAGANDKTGVAIKRKSVIADFYLPYTCCSDCTPLEITLITPLPLTATAAEPVCDETGTNFTVAVNITGGTSPYKIDGTAITGNSKTVSIPNATAKQLLIEDSRSQYFTLNIPSHTCVQVIKATLGKPDCIDNGASFFTTLFVAGGLPPYALTGNATSINENEWSIKTANGQSQEIIIKDTAGTTKSVTIPAHNCETPCNLPCNGESEKCRYIFWLQKPSDNSFTKHVTKEAFLTLQDENGEKFTKDVTDLFRDKLDVPLSGDEDYNSVIAAFFMILNELVPGKFKEPEKPFFTYDPATQTILIDRYSCHEFEMHIQSSISGLEMNMTVLYDTKGVVIRSRQMNNGGVQVPKFDCEFLNKCTGANRKKCSEQLVIDEIDVAKFRGGYVFNAKPRFERMLWYFENGRPAYSDESKPTIRFETDGRKKVTLLVINSDGCFGMKEKTFD